ncbi:MAG: hypothetical protein ABJ360_24500 [Roseobacter sp.]
MIKNKLNQSAKNKIEEKAITLTGSWRRFFSTLSATNRVIVATSMTEMAYSESTTS